MAVDFRIYLIADRRQAPESDILQAVAGALEGGLRAVQLRENAFARLRPFGGAITLSLRNARLREDGAAAWEEEDYCIPPLAQERSAVLDAFFGDLVHRLANTLAFERRCIRSRFVSLLHHTQRYASVARLAGAAHRRSRCVKLFSRRYA